MLEAQAERQNFRHLRYLNLRFVAVRWIQKHRKSDFSVLPPFRVTADSYTKGKQRNSLGSVMRLTDFQAPTDYAPGKITSLFNAVMSDLKLREQSPKQTYKHLI